MENKRKSIVENDVILVYIENQASFFARVEKIYPDVKPNWWRVNLLILKIPLVVTTWILDNEQIRGADFTLNGTPVRFEKVISPEKNAYEKKEETTISSNSNHKARILSFDQGKEQQ